MRLWTPLAASALTALAVQAAGAQPPRLPPPETQVEGVTVTGVLAPLPKVGVGAPLYTDEELAAAYKDAERVRRESKDATRAIDECWDGDPNDPILQTMLKPYRDGDEAGQAVLAAANSARRATQQTLDLRRRVAVRQASVAELEAAELARQTAVNRLVEARKKVEDAKASAVYLNELALETFGRPREPKEVPPANWTDRLAADEIRRRTAPSPNAVGHVPARYADLAVEKVAVRATQDRKGPLLVISGQVRNTRDRKIAQPPLSFTALDSQGLPLLSQTAHGKGSIAPGKSSPFAFEMRPKPDLAKTVEVTFAEAEGPRLLFPPPNCPAPVKRQMPINP